MHAGVRSEASAAAAAACCCWSVAERAGASLALRAASSARQGASGVGRTEPLPDLPFGSHGLSFLSGLRVYYLPLPPFYRQ
jgi:hypothetical protein